MALTKISTGGVKDDTADESKLKVSNAGSNGQFLQKQSGNTGGLTWATVDSTPEGTVIKSTGESGTAKFLRVDGDGTCSWQVPPDNNTVYTHPNHSGEVTSSADGAQTIADNVVDEANLKVSNAPTNGYMLTAQSGNTGGLTWAAAPSGGLSVVDQWHYASDRNFKAESGNSNWLGEGTANAWNSGSPRSSGTFTRPSNQGLPIGTGISNTADSSSGSDRYGWFKFPSTGVYKVDLNLHVDRWGYADKNVTYKTEWSTNGGTSFTTIASALVWLDHPAAQRMLCQHTNFVNVTDTSDDIVKFSIAANVSGDNAGISIKQYSNVTFMKVN